MLHFWADALERAVKTAAQTAVAAIGTSTVLNEVDWAFVASTTGIAAAVSLLTSIASHGITGKNTASLINRNDKDD